MRRDETKTLSEPLTRGGPLDALRFLAAFAIAVFPILGKGSTVAEALLAASGCLSCGVYCAARGVQARFSSIGQAMLHLKARLVALAPKPDPSFDPFALEAERAPRVREILLHSGPLPGGFYGREQLEGSAGLAWG